VVGRGCPDPPVAKCLGLGGLGVASVLVTALAGRGQI
jgi:hypothetical protein